MKNKRLISLLLCLMMLVSLIPAQVFAEGGDAESEEIIILESFETEENEEDYTAVTEETGEEETGESEETALPEEDEVPGQEEEAASETGSAEEESGEPSWYPWIGMSDDELEQYINDEENREFLTALANGSDFTAYDSLMARIELVADELLRTALTEKLESFADVREGAEDGDEIPEQPEVEDEDAEETEDAEKSELGEPEIPFLRVHDSRFPELSENPLEPYVFENTEDELYNIFNATYVDVNTAGRQLADPMANRVSQMTVYVRVPTSWGYGSNTFWINLYNGIVNGAFQNDGNPAHGDYLSGQGAFGGIDVNWSTARTEGSYYLLQLLIRPTYWTTASQEASVNSTVGSIISSLRANVPFLTDYEKITAIYNWLTANVRYNYDDSSNVFYHSAYSALCLHYTVCQGYSLAFYRLCREAGVSNVRYVWSDAMNHAWNIVDPGNGTYYLVDATWDEGRSPDYYRYFLRGRNYWSANHVSNGVSVPGETTPLSYYLYTENGALYIDAKWTSCTAVANVSSSDFSASGLPNNGRALTPPTLTLAANYADYIKVAWNPSPYAENYRLSYRIGNGAWVKFCETISTAVKFTNPVDGATYTFRVECITKDGKLVSKESNRIGQMRLTTPKTTVNRFGGAGETGGFKVSWTATTGGSQYKIYYREKGSGTWTLYTMIPKTANTTFCNIKASITNTNPKLPNLIAGHSYEFMVLTCTTVASVTSGFPTAFTAYMY